MGKPRKVKTILNNKRTAGGVSTSDFKSYTTVARETVQYRHKADILLRGIRDPDVTPHTYDT